MGNQSYPGNQIPRISTFNTGLAFPGKIPKKQSYARRKFLTKVIRGDLSTGEVVMKERQHRQSAQCPFCTEDKDLVHIFTCSSENCWGQNQIFTHSVLKALSDILQDIENIGWLDYCLNFSQHPKHYININIIKTNNYNTLTMDWQQRFVSPFGTSSHKCGTIVSLQYFYDKIRFFEHNTCKNQKMFKCNTSIDSACFSWNVCVLVGVQCALYRM